MPEAVMRNFERANFAAQPIVKYANWKQRFESDAVDSAIESSSSPLTASPTPNKDVSAQSAPRSETRTSDEQDDNIFGFQPTSYGYELQQRSDTPISEVIPAKDASSTPMAAALVTTKYAPVPAKAEPSPKLLGQQAGMVPNKSVEKQVKAFVDIATPGDQFLAMMQSGTLGKVIRRRYGGPPAKAATESVNEEDHTLHAVAEDSTEAVAAKEDNEVLESVAVPRSAAEAESTAPDTDAEDPHSPAPHSECTAPFASGNFENFVINDTLPYTAQHVYGALCAAFGEFNFELAGTEPNDQGHYFVSLTKLPPINQPVGTITHGKSTPFNFPQELKLQLNLSDHGTLPGGPGFEASMRQVLRGVMAQCCPLHERRHDPRKCQTWVPIRRKEVEAEKEKKEVEEERQVVEEDKSAAVEHVAANGAVEDGSNAGHSSLVQPESYGIENDLGAIVQPDADERDGAWTSYREVSLLDM